MRIFTPNKIRFLVLISILLLIFSIMPSWTALQIGSFIPTEHAKTTLRLDHDSDVEIWSTIIGLDNEPVFNQESYYNENIERFGPEATLKRSQNSKTYIGPDNLVTMQIYSGEIHYLSSLGTWEEFNNEIKEYYLKPPSMDIKYDYACEANTIRSYFRADYSMPNTIATGVGDDFIIWEPSSMVYINNIGMEVEVGKPMQAKAIVKNNKILYPGSYQNAADLFTVIEHKVKHEIILDRLPVVPTKVMNYEPITLSLNGNLIPSDELRLYIKGESKPINRELTTSQALELYAKDSSNRIYLPAPIAYEFYNKAVSTPCEYSIEPMGDIFRLSINTPYSWLAEPARQFPVVIDPTMAGQQIFNIQPPESLSNDTWIGNNTVAMETQNFGEDEHLYIGGIGLNYRTLLQFDLSSLPPSDINFQSAFLKLTQQERGDLNYDIENREVSIHKVEETWKEGTGILNIPTSDGATWNSNGYRAWTGGAGGYFIVNEENKSIVRGTDLAIFSIDNLVNHWRNDPAQNYGLLVKYYAPGSAGSRYKVFYSSKAPPSYRPKLEVTFINSPPSVIMTNKEWDEDTEESETVIYMDEIFMDPNDDALEISIWNGTAWGDEFECDIFNVTIQESMPAKCQFKLKPNQFGTWKIILNATDQLAYTEANIIIMIRPVNDPPILNMTGDWEYSNSNAISVDDVTIKFRQDLYADLNVTGTDIDSTTLTFAYEISDISKITIDEITFKQRFNFNENTGNINFTPTNNWVGDFELNISISDNEGVKTLKDFMNFIFIVENINDPPIILNVRGKTPFNHTIALSAIQDERFTAVITGADIDMDIEWLAEELTFKVDNGVLTKTSNTTANFVFTPVNADVGEHAMNFSVEDKAGDKDYVLATITVANINDPPEIKEIKKDENSLVIDKKIVNLTTNPLTATEPNVTLILTAVDLDLDIDVGEKLTWSVNGIFSTEYNIHKTSEKTAEIQIVGRNFVNGEHELNITVIDNGTPHLRDWVLLKINVSIRAPLPVNLKPLVELITANPIVEINSILHINGTISDDGLPIDGKLKVWIIIGNFEGNELLSKVEATCTNGNFSYYFKIPSTFNGSSTEGDWYIKLWGNDGELDSDEKSTTLTIKAKEATSSIILSIYYIVIIIIIIIIIVIILIVIVVRLKKN